jgi:subtilase family serine protease
MISRKTASTVLNSCLALGLLLTAETTFGQALLNGHVPAAVSSLMASGVPSPDRQLRLAIGLPVRDQAGLDAFVAQVSNPASPNYRQYLTPAEFAQRFAPTAEDYQRVIDFAESHGLTVTATHPNRLIVDVNASVAQVERALHVTIRNYQHPVEAREFYAPDTEPVVDQIVPILHISGLDDYSLPRPHSRIKPLNALYNVSPNTGSGPSGTYRGGDFRAAYAPGVSLTGSGQSIGMLEYDGYHASDIATYVSQAGLPSVPLQNVMVDGYSGLAGSGQAEVCLDIEVAIAMAPGLSKVIVYEAPNPSPWEDILSRMANDNAAKQLSCSWGGGSANPTAEQIFQQMAAQGQSFFNATGDSDAFTGAIPFPSDSPNIVEVGGTTLSTISAGGAWSSETTWNWGLSGGSYVGSSGGVSTVYSIPTWQQGVSMSSNQGSTSFRNLPDVALTADNVCVVYKNGRTGNFGGTSCAAPLWAAFTALVNQQAASNGQSPVGFLNPALYAIGKSGNFNSDFHDITTGNNITSKSNGKFSAVMGYDLCTGWGTPQGASMIAALAGGQTGTTYNITTGVSPANSGTVTGGGTYASSATVTLTASPKSGYTFVNWTENGNPVSASATYVFTASADRSLVANFQASASQYTITLSVTPVKGGTVLGAGTFAAGSSRTVTAVVNPNGNFTFLHWTENGTVVSSLPSYTFTLNGNRTLVAQFKRHK